MMNLFSTQFPCNRNLTKEAFIKLVIAWAQSDELNALASAETQQEVGLKGIQWDGANYNIRWGDDVLSLEIQEASTVYMVGARSSLCISRGKYVIDILYNESEQMITIASEVETSRYESYHFALALVNDFVHTLIAGGFEGIDNGLKIKDTPRTVDSPYRMIQNLEETAHLPIVMVTLDKSGKPPLGVEGLAKKIAGLGHVILVPSTQGKINESLASMYSIKERMKHIIVFYPTDSYGHRKPQLFRIEKKVEDAVIAALCEYSVLREKGQLETWDGLTIASLKEEINRLQSGVDVVRPHEQSSEKQASIDQVDLDKNVDDTVVVSQPEENRLGCNHVEDSTSEEVDNVEPVHLVEATNETSKNGEESLTVFKKGKVLTGKEAKRARKAERRAKRRLEAAAQAEPLPEVKVSTQVAVAQTDTANQSVDEEHSQSFELDEVSDEPIHVIDMVFESLGNSHKTNSLNLIELSYISAGQQVLSAWRKQSGVAEVSGRKAPPKRNATMKKSLRGSMVCVSSREPEWLRRQVIAWWLSVRYYNETNRYIRNLGCLWDVSQSPEGLLVKEAFSLSVHVTSVYDKWYISLAKQVISNYNAPMGMAYAKQLHALQRQEEFLAKAEEVVEVIKQGKPKKEPKRMNPTAAIDTSLKLDMKDAQEEVRHYSDREVERLLKKINDLQGAVETLQAEKEQLEQEKKALQKENNKLHIENDKLMEELAKATDPSKLAHEGTSTSAAYQEGYAVEPGHLFKSPSSDKGQAFDTTISMDDEALPEPLLYRGEESDLYPDEVKDIILDMLVDYRRKCHQNSRRDHIIQDVLNANHFNNNLSKRKEELKNRLKTYRKLDASLQSYLRTIGFVITSEGKHYKWTYHKDPRYVVTTGKTVSDAARAGRNIYAAIEQQML